MRSRAVLAPPRTTKRTRHAAASKALREQQLPPTQRTALARLRSPQAHRASATHKGGSGGPVPCIYRRGCGSAAPAAHRHQLRPANATGVGLVVSMRRPSQLPTGAPHRARTNPGRLFCQRSGFFINRSHFYELQTPKLVLSCANSALSCEIGFWVVKIWFEL